jgi:hypothetical protein
MFETGVNGLFRDMTTKEEIEDFFNRYASTMNNVLFGDIVDVNSFRGSFASYVVGANPAGIAGGKNDGDFGNSIKSGIDFYKRIGIISMNITAKDITILDEYHATARISWECIYNRNEDSGGIPFDVFYVLQVRDHVAKIFAYVTGDEQKALRDQGLI